jgi:acylphosphatase
VKARRFLVRGRVQGVGYRYFVVGLASHFGLAGWARNLPDGSVEVLAQGSEEDLEALHRRLEEGPPAAAVESVHSSEVAVEAGLATFGVRHR